MLTAQESTSTGEVFYSAHNSGGYRDHTLQPPGSRRTRPRLSGAGAGDRQRDPFDAAAPQSGDRKGCAGADPGRRCRPGRDRRHRRRRRDRPDRKRTRAHRQRTRSGPGRDQRPAHRRDPQTDRRHEPGRRDPPGPPRRHQGLRHHRAGRGSSRQPARQPDPGIQ